MKYYKNSKFTKAISSTGFITIVAFALIIVGAIGWFTFSHNNNINTTNPSDNSNLQSYSNNNDSYTSQEEPLDSIIDEPNVNINETVSEVPYTESEPKEDLIEEKTTFVLPIVGNISKGFSTSALQYSATYDDMRLHTGVDILCEKGSNIVAVGSGTVKSVVDDANLGRVITIEHLNQITVKYCGLASVNVNDGDKVASGDIIGTSGEIPSECTDNPHVHIEVIVDGETVSPLEALGLE